MKYLFLILSEFTLQVILVQNYRLMKCEFTPWLVGWSVVFGY